MSDQTSNAAQARPLTLKEFCDQFKIGRTTAWRETRDGKLTITKVRGRSFVAPDAADAWLEGLPKKAGAQLAAA